MRIKVCGITKPDQLMQLDEMGVEFAGFIFYPKSPRYVFSQMNKEQLRKLKGKQINKVGVFVNTPAEEVLHMVDACGLYLVQLHGDESPKYCERISNYVTVVKAFRMREGENILWRAKDYQDVADMFLFDTEGAGYGGTGKKFNWKQLEGETVKKPFFLSGGIEPTDAELLKEFSKSSVAKDLFSVDINSKFEIAPGIKDMAKVQAFVTAIKG
ncbi:MAG: phosphoribosylanthranilate isomerase [Bacteroidetes bacterium]|jgi:phosphoribosylanthranilate isomerase|nr:phosphoribosylanthranilate isomerase [Bacteroidota bacterium]